MNPSKNKIFCRACNKQKLLFKEEQNALNFIKFNADKWCDNSPVRAYYCPVCMGWHLTSKEGESYENPIINKVIEQYHNGYKGQLGRYGNSTIKMSNAVLTECSILKRNLEISGKNVWRKTKLIKQYRNILSERLSPYDFMLIEKTVNETMAIIERRYNPIEIMDYNA